MIFQQINFTNKLEIFSISRSKKFYNPSKNLKFMSLSSFMIAYCNVSISYLVNHLYINIYNTLHCMENDAKA